MTETVQLNIQNVFCSENSTFVEIGNVTAVVTRIPNLPEYWDILMYLFGAGFTIQFIYIAGWLLHQLYRRRSILAANKAERLLIYDCISTPLAALFCYIGGGVTAPGDHWTTLVAIVSIGFSLATAMHGKSLWLNHIRKVLLSNSSSMYLRDWKPSVVDRYLAMLPVYIGVLSASIVGLFNLFIPGLCTSFTLLFRLFCIGLSISMITLYFLNLFYAYQVFSEVNA